PVGARRTTPDDGHPLRALPLSGRMRRRGRRADRGAFRLRPHAGKCSHAGSPDPAAAIPEQLGESAGRSQRPAIFVSGSAVVAASRQACAAAACSPNVANLRLRLDDHARMLTWAGRFAEALATLPPVDTWDDPYHSIAERLLWAEALLAAGETAQSCHYLQRA